MVDISVIIPTYNRRNTITECINSVTNQPVEDVEIIVVDDYSTDGTEDVVRSLSNEQVIYIRHEMNKGANAARSTGLTYANGQFITFLDSDDRYKENFLLRTTKVLNELPEDYAGVFCGGEYIEDGNIRKVADVPEGRTKLDFILEGGTTGGFSRMIFRSEIFNNIPELDTNLPAYQDLDFCIQVLEKYDMYGINERLVQHGYTNHGRISKDPNRKLVAVDRFLEKNRGKMKSSGIARFEYSRGLCLASKKDFSGARRCFRNAIKSSSFRESPKYYYHLLATALGEYSYPHFMELKERMK